MGEPNRGQDVTIDIYQDGAPVLIIEAQSFNRNLDSTEERQTRLGTRLEEPRQKIHGWSGSVTFEEEGPVLDDLLDILTTGYFNELPIERIDISETNYYAETGETRTYVYPSCTYKIQRAVSGKNDETTATLDWMSATRERI